MLEPGSTLACLCFIKGNYPPPLYSTSEKRKNCGIMINAGFAFFCFQTKKNSGCEWLRKHSRILLFLKWLDDDACASFRSIVHTFAQCTLQLFSLLTQTWNILEKNIQCAVWFQEIVLWPLQVTNRRSNRSQFILFIRILYFINGTCSIMWTWDKWAASGSAILGH